MSRLKNILYVAILGVSFVCAFTPTLTFAETTKDVIQGGVNDAAGESNKTPASLDSTISTVINLISVALGVVAVIMIIVGGFKYVTSSGNAEAAKSAKNTIIYALIGLVVAAVAQIIVRFVLTNTVK